MFPSKLSGIRGGSLRHSPLFTLCPTVCVYSTLAHTEFTCTLAPLTMWDRQFLFPPPAPTILTARLRGV